MTSTSNNSFSFLVLAFNHEDYIIEHLESIKFLVKKYAKKIKVKLVVNDDCSNDNTVILIEKWLLFNEDIFFSVIRIYNSHNLGTCKSLINMLEQVDTAHVKITAGDDVYSYENIFALSERMKRGEIASGFPLNLKDSVISENVLDIMMIISSYYVYESKELIKRFKFPSNNNAPNITYDVKALKSNSVIKYLEKFDVIEDWPIQIAIAKNIDNSSFALVDKVYTYYRRTSGSTYIVAGSRFKNDKIRIYKDLILDETSLINRFVIKNRLFCFNLSNNLIRKSLNLSLYIYICQCMSNICKINLHYKNLDLNNEQHSIHYEKIRLLSCEFIRDIN